MWVMEMQNVGLVVLCGTSGAHTSTESGRKHSDDRDTRYTASNPTKSHSAHCQYKGTYSNIPISAAARVPSPEEAPDRSTQDVMNCDSPAKGEVEAVSNDNMPHDSHARQDVHAWLVKEIEIKGTWTMVDFQPTSVPGSTRPLALPPRMSSLMHMCCWCVVYVLNVFALLSLFCHGFFWCAQSVASLLSPLCVFFLLVVFVVRSMPSARDRSLHAIRNLVI